jgi:hypothetical protein
VIARPSCRKSSEWESFAGSSRLLPRAMSEHWPDTMPSSALPTLATVGDRRPKSVALEHNSMLVTHGRGTLNRSGYAGFMVEASPAGTPGGERSRRPRIRRVGRSRVGCAGAGCLTSRPTPSSRIRPRRWCATGRRERATATDSFGFEQPDRRLGQDVFVGITDTSDGCRNALQDKGFRGRDRFVLRSSLW